MSYQPKTGAPCACKPGAQRDNCPACEGTGHALDFAAIRARTVTRYVVTHVGSDGLRTLTFAAQGRNTHATREEAQESLDLFAPQLRAKMLGSMADTLEVRACECWPGHLDPCRVYFD